MSEAMRPGLQPSRDSAFFWQGLRDEKLLCQSCDHCGRLRHPPRPMCPDCGALQWSARPLSGRGRVHAWIKPVHPLLPMFEEGFLVALVELDEGIRLLSNLCEISAADVRNEMPVEVFFIEVDAEGAKVHQFRPIGELGHG